MAEVHNPKSVAKGTEGTSTRCKDVGQLVELMLRLGKAELASGEAVTQVELFMRRMATAYGIGYARIVVLPTAVFVTIRTCSSRSVRRRLAACCS